MAEPTPHTHGLPDPPPFARRCSRFTRPRRGRSARSKSSATTRTPRRKSRANTRTIPGIITQRGCTYAGCRGVVIGPIYDMLHITHGPVGCGYLRLDDPPQPGAPAEGRGELPAILHEHRHAGGPDHLRRREEARGKPSGGLRTLQTKAICDLLHLPGGPHRRRHPHGRARDEGRTRHQRLRLLAAKATRASASPPATTSPTTACSNTSSASTTRPTQAEFTHQPPRRIQHRRRRVGDRRRCCANAAST